jgi:hypothetical protein
MYRDVPMFRHIFTEEKDGRHLYFFYDGSTVPLLERSTRRAAPRKSVPRRWMQKDE